MSRGPGKIERALGDLLVANPAGTFMLEDLAAVAYPGLEYIEKKHRVSIWRAVHNAKMPDNSLWRVDTIGSYAGTPYVLHNWLNLRSTTVAQERWNVWQHWRTTISDAGAEERCLSPEYYIHQFILKDGPYPLLIDCRRAKINGEDAKSDELWEAYKEANKKTDRRSKEFRGPIHPHFLRDCITLSANDGSDPSHLLGVEAAADTPTTAPDMDDLAPVASTAV